MNAGLGMGVAADTTASGFFAAATPLAAGTATVAMTGSANAETMKGRFAALLAALELGAEPSAPSDAAAAQPPVRAALGPSPEEVTVSPAPRREDLASAAAPPDTNAPSTEAAQKLTRWREWIVDVAESNGAREVQHSESATNALVERAVAEELSHSEYQVTPEVEALMQSLAALISPSRSTAQASGVTAGAANDATKHASAAITAPKAATSYTVADLEGLHPELKVRVERVITRMQDEFGHSVEVVETLRSQSRQNALFAQGRTAPGEIVTWTRDSLHRHGKAADLRVDGSWDNREAYTRLQQIAREEGLATLGDRDAGHVEWRVPGERATRHSQHRDVQRDVQREAAVRAAASGASATPAVATHAMPQPVAATARAARVAELAPVARVAKPAEVARVAEAGRSSRPASVAPAEEEPMRDAVANSESIAPVAAESVVQDAPSAGTAPTAQGDARSSEHSTAAPAATAPTAAATPTQTQRIDRIDAIDESRRQQPMQSITLRVEDAQGQDHRIRVDLRGTEVHADITAASDAQARAIADSLPELKQRLGAQGLESAGVQVRSWIGEAAASSERQPAQRDGQQSQQQQQHSHRDPRQSHQAPRHWYDAEGDNV